MLASSSDPLTLSSYRFFAKREREREEVIFINSARKNVSFPLPDAALFSVARFKKPEKSHKTPGFLNENL